MRIQAGLTEATPFLPPLDIRSFDELAPNQVATTLAKAAGLKKSGIIHISASRLREDKETGRKYIGGGGLAETLRDQIPLESSCGLRSSLYLPNAQSSYYPICQKIFSQIIGETDCCLLPSDIEEYTMTCADLRPQLQKALMQERPEIVIMHDFEFLPLISAVPNSLIKILLWHVDFPSNPSDSISVLMPYLKQFDVAIAADKEIAGKLASVIPNTRVISPSINPQTIKLSTPTSSDRKKILEKLSIDYNRSILSQIGRISNQKDPISVVNIFKRVRERFPGTQLVLAGMFNLPNEDFTLTLQELRKQIGQDRDIHLITSPLEISPFSNDEFLAALYSSSDILINMGKNEGFGLVMTEAMWHGNIVVAMDSPGARTQIDSGHNGFIISDLTQAVEKVGDILREPDKFKDIKEHAKQSVRDRFLITNYMEEMIDLYKSLQKL